MLGWIIFWTWILSIVFSATSFLLYYSTKEDLFKVTFIIFLTISILIPFIVIIVSVYSGTELYQNLLQNILK